MLTVSLYREKTITRDIVSSEGVPSRSVIRSNWWTTFFPGKRGFPINTSAKMQPILQISIAGVYCIQYLSVNPPADTKLTETRNQWTNNS